MPEPTQSSLPEGLIQYLVSFLSPREAEAKVTPKDPESQKTLDSITTQNSPGINPFMKLLYSIILQKAQAEPANVDVSSGVLSPDVLGQYQKHNKEITTSKSLNFLSPDNPMRQDNFVHEILHFLFSQYGEQSKNTDMREIARRGVLQHELMKNIIGTDTGKFSPYFYQALRPFTSSAPTEARIPQDVQREIMQRLFQGTPLEHGVIQVAPQITPPPSRK